MRGAAEAAPAATRMAVKIVEECIPMFVWILGGGWSSLNGREFVLKLLYGDFRQ